VSVSDPGRPFMGFPLTVAPGGSIATTGLEDHMRDMILQVLLTEPGERLNLPGFGCGVRQFVFAANNDVLRSTAQLLVTHNLQRWLGDRIDVSQVTVTSQPGEEQTLTIDVAYVIRQSQSGQQLRVTL
jgi:Bacteriophage baseplate protein W